MPVRMLLEGFNELRDALMAMGPELQAEAAQRVQQAAERAADRLLAVYPGEGRLKQGVYVVDKSSEFAARWRVESRTAEAEWWEFGTQNRHTQEGWNRGSTPAHPNTGLISIAKDERRDMLADLVTFVRARGFVVTED